jgi:hypothetical protein
MLFRKKEKVVPTFIKKPVFDPHATFVSNLYDYVYFPPMTIDMFDRANITGPGKALSMSVVNIIKNLAYQLYQIPAVRNYFGKEFVHGFSAKMDPNHVDTVIFDNLDDTPEAIQYTKEITAALAIILKELLDRYDIYIFYQGDSIQFLEHNQIKRMAHTVTENRIVWME